MAKKIKSYDEAEIIEMFNLTRLVGNTVTPIMDEWTNTSTSLNDAEQELFNKITKNLPK
jgi:hypothetical protein